jgi:glycosyltransferase involved in cell wall biosynthesis
MPQKRHDVLLEAWRRAALPHKLVLLTAASAALEQMIRSKGLEGRVLVAGFRKNPYPWMRAAELLVLSSDREGMPNVLVEALACGTRVVSTDCPSGPREVMRGELARYLVPPGNPEALAHAMRTALADPLPDLSVIEAEFSAERMAGAYESLARAA